MVIGLGLVHVARLRPSPGLVQSYISPDCATAAATTSAAAAVAAAAAAARHTKTKHEQQSLSSFLFILSQSTRSFIYSLSL